MQVRLEALPLGPVAVAARAWKARGTTRLTAIVKASFRVINGRPMEPVSPSAISARETPRTSAARSSVRRSSDLGLVIRRPEIILDAVAFAGGSRSVDEMTVVLAVERGGKTIRAKELKVLGDRTALPNQPPDRPLPFRCMPIIYERAYGGGAYEENPSGVGVTPEGGGRITLPNIVLAKGADSDPAGFGPIPRAWLARRILRGSLAAAVADEAPYVELPADFDDAYFQAAPPDQQLDALLPGDVIVLGGLHPEEPLVKTIVPPVRGVAYATTTEAARLPIELSLDTLFVDTTNATAELVFRGSIEVRPADLGRIRVEGATAPLPAGSPSFSAPRVIFEEETVTLAESSREATMVLETDVLADIATPQGVRPKGVGRGGTMLIEPEMPAAVPTAPTEDPPRVRAATLELSLDAAPVSTPFGRRAMREPSPPTTTAERAATPWGPAETRSAPSARPGMNATLVVERESSAPVDEARKSERPARAEVAAPARPKVDPWRVAVSADSENRPAQDATAPARKRPVIQQRADHRGDLYKNFKRR